MKKKLRVYLLVVSALLMIFGVYAQVGQVKTEADLQRLVRDEREQTIKGIVNISTVYGEDPAKARESASAYIIILDKQLTLDPRVRPFSKSEADYLKGHLRAYEISDSELYAYYDKLIKDTGIVADQPIMAELQYMIEKGQGTGVDRVATNQLLLKAFKQKIGESSPGYYLIQVDQKASEGNIAAVNDLMIKYGATRTAVEDKIVPRKKAIYDRLMALQDDDFYNNPTTEKGTALKGKLVGIRSDLDALYEEISQMQGVTFSDDVDKIRGTEDEIIRTLIQNIDDYLNGYSNNQAQIKIRTDIIRPRIAELLTKETKRVDNYIATVDTLDNWQKYGKQGQDYTKYRDAELLRLFYAAAQTYTFKQYSDTAAAIIDDKENYVKVPEEEKAKLLVLKRDYEDAALKYWEEYENYLNMVSDDVKPIYEAAVSEYLNNLRVKLGYENEDIINEYEIAILEKATFDVDRMPIPPDQSVSQLVIDQTRFDAQREYLELQAEFRYIRNMYAEFKAIPIDNANKSAREAKRAAIDDRERAYLAKASKFNADYPNFQGFEISTGGFLVSNADLYYNMGEIEYDLNSTSKTQALAYFDKVLDIDPDHALRESVLYNRGFITMVAAKEQVNNNRATTASTQATGAKFSPATLRVPISSFEEIRDNYPDSALRDEAIYHLGNMYFLIGGDDSNLARDYYARANQCFDTIIQRKDSPYYYHALYQRGFVGLNLASYDSYVRSMKDNVELLTSIESGKITDPVYVNTYKEAAIDNIAFALIALDGEDFSKEAEGSKVNQFLDGITDEETVAAIYDRAAMRKNQDLNAPKQAIDLMLARVRTFPNALGNPAIIDSTVVLYNQYYRDLDANSRAGLTNPLDYRYAQYVRIKNSYNQNSEWYKKNMDKPQIAEQLKVIDKAYDLIEIRLRNNFVTDPTKDNLAAYKNHIDQYKEFTALHGTALDARELAWNKNITTYQAMLAEKSTNPQDWVAAINTLYAYNDNPKNKADFNYEGLAYSYTQTLYNDQMPKLKAGGYTAPEGVPADTVALYDYYVAGALRFRDKLLLPENQSAANTKLAEEIMLSLGDISFDSGRYDKALEHYGAQLAKANELTDPAAKKAAQRNLYLKLAQTYDAQKNYSQAEASYRLALGVASDAQDREIIQNSIAIQIQNNIDAAKASGNYLLVGDEYLRFAQEYKVSNPARYLGFMQEAKKAYLEANQAQKAIDILNQLASERSDSQEVYALSYEAWNIAETKLNDGIQAQRLKDAYIAKYPMTIEAYALRVETLDNLAKNSSTREAAADGYMALHNEARAKTVNIGEDKPEDLYLTAIELYRQNGNQEKLMTSLINFIGLYPNHQNVTPYMIYLADEYQKQGNEAEYVRYSRAVFLRDKTQYARYQNIANAHLGKIAFEFDAASIKATKNTEFVQADWDLAYAKRDEFKAAEAAYKKEGLTFNSETMYANIANLEAQRKHVEARIAFIKSYDTQLNAIERTGFLSKSPAALITVNANTTWKNHLFGGKPNRVAALRPLVNAEVSKVIKLVEAGAQYNLDNQRRTRALNLISKIDEHAADAITAQTELYMQISNELAPYKNRQTMSQEEYDTLIDGLRGTAAMASQDYLNDSYAQHLAVYNTYYIPGYRDANTAYSVSKLEEWKLVPEYQKNEYLLGEGWTLELQKPLPGSGNLLSQATVTTTPNGFSLGKLMIPADNALILKKNITTKVRPDFGFVQMIYPFDAEVKLNNTTVEPAYVPTDTLTAGDPNTLRYAVLIGNEYWTEGVNNLTLTFPNKAVEQIPLFMSLQVFTNAQTLAEAVSTETVKYQTGTDWKAVVTDANGNESLTSTVVAQKFNIPFEKIVGMDKTSAKPIWVTEALDARVPGAVFEYSFDMDTAFREGYITFVAPMEARITLNGTEIASGEALDYDADPLVVYPTRINFDAQNIVNGKNTLRVTVTNGSDFRGMLAEVTITKTVKE
ncbi:MAG TPA: tetratricopeptide repeat protein [Candidatus Cloacimonadota bacterium]|nr:tetratricopeptide repeat protein [Candidatus Cloacimonadota bacterium]